jgi:hypothetical protein
MPCLVLALPSLCRYPALVAGGRSLLRATFSPLTTCGAADLRRSKMQTLVELQPTASPAGDSHNAFPERRADPHERGPLEDRIREVVAHSHREFFKPLRGGQVRGQPLAEATEGGELLAGAA